MLPSLEDGDSPMYSASFLRASKAGFIGFFRVNKSNFPVQKIFLSVQNSHVGTLSRTHYVNTTFHLVGCSQWIIRDNFKSAIGEGGIGGLESLKL